MDGAVIQEATQAALADGFRLRDTFTAVRAIAARVDVPILVMTYWNPVLLYGVDRYAVDLLAAGDEIPRHGLGTAQDPEHETAHGRRTACRKLGQTGQRAKQGDEAHQRSPFLLDRSFPVHHSRSLSLARPLSERGRGWGWKSE